MNHGGQAVIGAIKNNDSTERKRKKDCCSRWRRQERACWKVTWTQNSIGNGQPAPGGVANQRPDHWAWTPIDSLTLRDRHIKHPNDLEHSNQHQTEREGGQETWKQPLCFLSSHYTRQVSYFSPIILNTNKWHLLSIPIRFKVIPPLDVYKTSNYFTCFLEKLVQHYNKRYVF